MARLYQPGSLKLAVPSKPLLGADVRQRIGSALREDTQELQQLINMDLSNWHTTDLHLNAQS